MNFLSSQSGTKSLPSNVEFIFYRHSKLDIQRITTLKQLLLLLILTTLASAQKWKVLRFPEQSTNSLTHIYSYDVNTVWVGGTKGFLYYSTDRGANWFKSELPGGSTVRSIHFFSSEEGIILTSNRSYVYSSGMSFSQVPPKTKIFRTTDAGKTWQPVFKDGSLFKTDIHFFDSANGIALGSIESRLITSDGGATWELIKADSSFKISEIFGFGDFEESKQVFWFDDSSALILGEDNELALTLDTAKTWALIEPHKRHDMKTLRSFPLTDDDLDLNSFAIATESTIVLAADDGGIVQSDNGGQSWSYQEYDSKMNFTNVTFISENEGYMIGSQGIVFHTTDRGKKWKRLSFPSKETLTCQAVLKDGTHLIGTDDRNLYIDYPTPKRYRPEHRVSTPTELIKIAKKQQILQEMSVLESRFDLVQGISFNLPEPANLKINDSSYGTIDTLNLTLLKGEYTIEMTSKGKLDKRHSVDIEKDTVKIFDEGPAKAVVSMVASMGVGSTIYGWGFGPSLSLGARTRNSRIMGTFDFNYGLLGNRDGDIGEENDSLRSLSHESFITGGGVEYGSCHLKLGPLTIVPRAALGLWMHIDNPTINSKIKGLTAEDFEIRETAFFRPGLDLELGRRNARILLGGHGYMGEFIGGFTIRGGVSILFD